MKRLRKDMPGSSFRGSGELCMRSDCPMHEPHAAKVCQGYRRYPPAKGAPVERLPGDKVAGGSKGAEVARNKMGLNGVPYQHSNHVLDEKTDAFVPRGKVMRKAGDLF